MSKPILALIAIGVALLIAVGYWFMPGGNKGQTGPSDYDLTMQAAKEAADALSSQGGRVKDAPNPLGKKAYAVNLSRLTITDKLLEDTQAIGTIIDLDLSKSTVTDDQLGKMSEMGLATFLTKFDLSNTDVSDAGLEKLKNMVVLQQLNLTGTKCTKAGADKFKRNREAQKNIRTHNPTIKFN